MDIRTVLIAALAFILICILGLIMYSRRQHKLSSSVVATITKVEVEATSISSGWVVTAQWLDQHSGQNILFRSHRLQFPPHLPVGGQVKIDIDPRNLSHYRMNL